MRGVHLVSPMTKKSWLPDLPKPAYPGYHAGTGKYSDDQMREYGEECSREAFQLYVDANEARIDAERELALSHAAGQEVVIPSEGWALVPVKPTVMMHNAGAALIKPASVSLDHERRVVFEPAYIDPSEMYRAMISAAPKAPAVARSEGEDS